MYRFTLLLLSILLLSTMRAHAEGDFVISASLGNASIGNISGYDNSSHTRIDGSFFPRQEFGMNIFRTRYSGFDSSGGGNNVSIAVDGYGLGVTRRWLRHTRAQPYVRIEYMRWSAEANGLNRILAKDKGGSAGLATGVLLPVRGMFGITAELAGYNNVSDADIWQWSLGLAFTF